MQTFKTIVVVGTLLCVGYGAHVIMNKPISNQPLGLAERVWDDLNIEKPEVDLGADANTLVDLPPLGGSLPGVATTTLASESEPPRSEPAPTGSTGSGPTLNPPPMSAPSGSQLASNDQPGGEILPPSGPNSLTSPPSSVQLPSQELTPSTATAQQPMSPGQLVPVPPAATSAPPQLSETPAPTQLAADNLQTAAELNAATIPDYSSTWSNGFEEMWNSVQLKLQSSQFVDALLALSLFYNDQELTGEQRHRMITLLDQLAGTVIYSPDYHMISAHIVQPGETLAAIAANYSVPESLLARINGVASPELQPGTELKVLRGPFRGELNIETRELTLFLGRYYAGRFSVGVGRDLPAQVAMLEVSQIGGAKAFVDRRTGQEVAAGDAENPYGAYWIGLHDPGMPEYNYLGIHSTGAAVDANDTRGCISVSEEDASDLQAILSAGSKIALVR